MVVLAFFPSFSCLSPFSYLETLLCPGFPPDFSFFFWWVYPPSFRTSDDTSPPPSRFSFPSNFCAPATTSFRNPLTFPFALPNNCRAWPPSPFRLDYLMRTSLITLFPPFRNSPPLEEQASFFLKPLRYRVTFTPSGLTPRANPTERPQLDKSAFSSSPPRTPVSSFFHAVPWSDQTQTHSLFFLGHHTNYPGFPKNAFLLSLAARHPGPGVFFAPSLMLEW